MFATEFTYVNSTYRLIVDSTLAIKTAAWLEQQGVVFDRYFKHEGFCKFIFISAPDKAIALISAKYPLPEVKTTPRNPAYTAYQEKCRLEDERKEALNNVATPTFYFNYYNGVVATVYWIQCPSPESAIALESELREILAIPYNYSMGVSDNMIWFETPEEFQSYFSKSEMPRLLYSQLIGMFDNPFDYNDATPDGVDPTFLEVEESNSSTYYFADCYTRQSIKAKYRELSKVHHPDAGGDSDIFCQVSEQYENLIAQFG